MAVGDRVMAGTQFGGYAEEVVVPQADAIPLADDLSFEQGAAIPVNYATAWAALLGYGSLREGDRVLIQAAAGGVGIAATQIARRYGAEIWGTSSPGKHDAIRAQGVQHPLDYTRDGWWSAVPPLDIVLDAIGGPSFKRSMGMLRPGGRLIGYGASSVNEGEKKNMLKVLPKALPMLRGFNLIDQMQNSKAFIGLNMLTLWKDRGSLAPWIDPVAGADRATARCARSCTRRCRSTAPATRTGSSPSAATSARSCWCPERCAGPDAVATLTLRVVPARPPTSAPPPPGGIARGRPPKPQLTTEDVREARAAGKGTTDG